MKEKKKIVQHGNVVLFPGTVERLIEEAHSLTEKYQFSQANELFEQVYDQIDQDELHLSVYTYSLYEAKSFQRAKEVSEQLLAIGPTMYFEAMELYLTICMQLRQFKQVEKIIESLLEEGAIPQEQIEKFKRLKELNADIADNQVLQDDALHVEDELEFEAQAFLQKPLEEQLFIVHSLTERNVRPIVEELLLIVEHEAAHAFVQSLILVLLVEQQVTTSVTIRKFGRAQIVNPAELLLPTKMPQFEAVSNAVLERLEQEPSKLELVQYLIAKHAIVTYPFEWLDYESDDVAHGYIELVKAMFGDIPEIDDKLLSFLQELEKISELQ